MFYQRIKIIFKKANSLVDGFKEILIIIRQVKIIKQSQTLEQLIQLTPSFRTILPFWK